MLNKVVIPGLFPYWLSIFLFLFSLLSIQIYDELLKMRSKKVTISFVLLVFLISIYFAFYSLATYLEIWGPGIYLACISVPVAIMLCLSWMKKSSNYFYKGRAQRKGINFMLIGGFAIALMQLSPAIGFISINNFCYRQTERVGLELVGAMEIYKSHSGFYPGELSQLVPEYLEEVPLPPCTNLYRQIPFHVEYCDSGVTILVTWLLNIYRYNLISENWSQVDWLEGSNCAFLE